MRADHRIAIDTSLGPLPFAIRSGDGKPLERAGFVFDDRFGAGLATDNQTGSDVVEANSGG
jgi:hypothetical protein